MNISAPDAVLRAIANGLQRKLNLTPDQVFCSILPVTGIDEYAGDQLIVVCPQGDRPDGRGVGAQEGESLARRMSVKVQVFYRLKLDQHGLSSALLTTEAGNMLSFCEKIIYALSLSYLGGVLDEPLRYEGAGEPRWQDPEHGIVTREINYSAFWVVELPIGITMTDTDVT